MAGDSVDAGTDGYYLPGTVYGHLYIDTNGNGTQDPGEPDLANVDVLVTDSLGHVTTNATDANGDWSASVPPGSTSADVDETDPQYPAGYTQTEGDDPTVATAVAGDSVDAGNDGYYLPANLGNFVWNDLDGNGIQDPGEPGIPSVGLTLHDAVSNVVQTTLTDSNGFYAFTNLPPGSYFVIGTRPAGYWLTQQDQGGDDTVDSDADPATGRSSPVTLVSGEDNTTLDAGLYQPAAVGDYIWLDENWDGIQDPGEAGIPNVRVELLTNGTVIATTITDLNGLYLFTDLRPGTYTVRVDVTTLAPDLAGNQTFDIDGTLDHQAQVVLPSGSVYREADFGYNWSPSIPDQGAIGDRVWVDTDADGVQDLGEPGIPSVTVNLLADPAGTGNYTSLVATTQTDAAGLYNFPGLDVGAYVVRVDPATLPTGYTQTGDPDFFGAAVPAGQRDNRTTQPIILSPGDVFVNADFGYRFPAGSDLGDLVFFDANADGAFNATDGDSGIAGVTVVLLNGSGFVIASTITDANGGYLFTGLPAGTYTVWVNDSENVLDGRVQTADPDGGFDSRSTATLDGVNDNLTQDHGYTADRHDPLRGLIGDTIFLDRNGNGAADPGEGMESVTVRLYDSTGLVLLATTITDANGHYYFGGLEAATYQVAVVTGTLPNGGADLVNTVDPDTASPGDHRASVVLAAGQINLAQDFGYVASTPNTLGGTLWEDVNADGVLDADETVRFAGVTLVLRDVGGDIIGTTQTDAGGNYEFTGLADGNYTVDVTDGGNVLNGRWHSLGPNPGADSNSQVDPYPVVVNGGQTNRTGDFGYYLALAEMGDYVWYDINQNGIQDGGEPGLSNVRVTLRIEYPNGAVITLQTFTDGQGRYLFSNLLLDERFSETTTNNPTGGNGPRLQVSVDSNQGVLTSEHFNAALINAGDGSNDSRDHEGVFVQLRKGSRRVVYDFGYDGGPLLAVIGNVDAFTRNGQTIVRWETLESWGTAGFWLERLVDGQWVRISQDLIPFPLFGVAPIVYEETDSGAASGGTYEYRLVELENDGDILYYGPYTLTVDGAGRTYDAWASGFFTPEQLADPAISGRAADPDGDGLTNGQEFLAGTDPWNANSVLQVTAVRRTAEGLELVWNSVPGKIYRIAISQSMMGPFFPLEEAIVAAGSQTLVTLPVDFQDRQMYFQVILVGDAE